MTLLACPSDVAGLADVPCLGSAPALARLANRHGTHRAGDRADVRAVMAQPMATLHDGRLIEFWQRSVLYPAPGGADNLGDRGSTIDGHAKRALGAGAWTGPPAQRRRIDAGEAPAPPGEAGPSPESAGSHAYGLGADPMDDFGGNGGAPGGGYHDGDHEVEVGRRDATNASGTARADALSFEDDLRQDLPWVSPSAQRVRGGSNGYRLAAGHARVARAAPPTRRLTSLNA